MESIWTPLPDIFQLCAVQLGKVESNCNPNGFHSAIPQLSIPAITTAQR